MDDHVEAALQRLRDEWRSHGMRERMASRLAYWENVRRARYENALAQDIKREAAYQRALSLDRARDVQRRNEEDLAAMTAAARSKRKAKPSKETHHA